MKRIAITLLIVELVETDGSCNRAKKHEKREHHESHNYIIERQQAGAVSGVPTSRLIIWQTRNRHLPEWDALREKQSRRCRQALTSCLESFLRASHRLAVAFSVTQTLENLWNATGSFILVSN